GLGRLRDAIASLRELRPTYVSVTYGAGGSTRRQTIELVTQIQRDYGILPMAHLTCLGASQDEIREVLQRLDAAGVENVLTLRGEPPRGQSTFVPRPPGFRYACELAAFARTKFRFCLGGACYPEKHPEAPSLAEDLEMLARKVDAG